MDLKTFLTQIAEEEEATGRRPEFAKQTPPPPPIKALIHHLIPRDTLFATFLLKAKYIKNYPKVKTAGVNVTKGRVNCYYDEDFISGMPPGQLMFIVAHEFYHLVRLHLDRSARRRMNNDLYNVAADMIINEDILRDLKQVAGINLQMPTEDGKPIGLRISPEYAKEYPDYKKWTTEHLYTWLEAHQKQPPSSKDLLTKGAVVRINKTDGLGVITKVNSNGTYEVTSITEKEAKRILGID